METLLIAWAIGSATVAAWFLLRGLNRWLNEIERLRRCRGPL
jgi:HAMP domain-containing protein